MSTTEPQKDLSQQRPQSSQPQSRPTGRSSAAERERQAAHDRAGVEEERQAKLNAQVAENREAHRQAWNETDAALVSAQHQYAADVARMPTPEALEEMGSVVGDPTRGPAS